MNFMSNRNQTRTTAKKIGNLHNTARVSSEQPRQIRSQLKTKEILIQNKAALLIFGKG